ncbi:MAG: hypothetical protein FJ060_02285 [Cyanobacteria bacterium K_Offshore_0m_m2_072]|nr:hypothetical protein [Cyanobacteria bacterium K_Offshore_0m_m2_072]
MGLFDRLFAGKAAASAAEANAPKKPDNTVFLEPEASSSLGDVSFMKRSNTIRHTFPGTLDSPGNKEMVAEVASMEARLERKSEGLGGGSSTEESPSLTGGVPKPVKKTFAQQLSKAELDQRMKGSAVGVNVPGGPAAIKQAKEQEGAAQAQPAITQQPGGKPGDINPFKAMAKELRS